MTLAAHDPTVHSAYRFGALALLLAVGLLFASTASVSAHARYDYSEPASGSAIPSLARPASAAASCQAPWNSLSWARLSRH